MAPPPTVTIFVASAWDTNISAVDSLSWASSQIFDVTSAKRNRVLGLNKRRRLVDQTLLLLSNIPQITLTQLQEPRRRSL